LDQMSDKVRSTWDGIFAAEQAHAPHGKNTGIAALDEALDWLCDGSRSVIDFGCGNGITLMLCALRGTWLHTGIDFSREGIRLARESALHMDRGEFKFIEGGPECLPDIGDSSHDAAILSNIVDNLSPADALYVLDEIRRIVRPGGRIFVKLNPNLDPSQIREWNIRVVDGDLLDDGLLLWNLPTEKWAALLRERFVIEGCTEAYYPEHEQTNRIFLLRAADEPLPEFIPASEKNLADLAEVHAAAWRASHRDILGDAVIASHTAERHEAMFRSETEQPSIKTFLVRLGGKAVGMVSVDTQPDAEHPETGEVRAVYLLPEYCGRGLGRTLLDFAVSELNDHPEVYLWVMSSNTRARRCYEKFGFEFSGIEKPLLPDQGITEMKYRLNRKITED